MHTLWYVLGGIALLRLADNREGIGKIVDGPPEGKTPCLDGRFSTHKPGAGVCSYHAGWRGAKAPEKKEDRVLIQDLDRTIVGITNKDIEAHRSYLMKIYQDITNGRSRPELKEINIIWARFLKQYTRAKNKAIRARANTLGREKATTEKGKRARRILNGAIRDFERSERVLMKVLSFHAGVPTDDVRYRSMLKARTKASTERESGTYWGNTPADFTPIGSGRRFGNMKACQSWI